MASNHASGLPWTLTMPRFVWFHLRAALIQSACSSDGYGLGIIGHLLEWRPAPRLVLGPVWMGLLGGASLLACLPEHCSPDAAADRLRNGGRSSPTTWP